MAKKSRTKRGNRGDRRKYREERQTGGMGPIGLQLPPDTPVWKPKAGRYKVDIIPYAPSTGNPDVPDGEEYYRRVYFLYNNLGPNKKALVATGPTYGADDDPVQAELQRLRDSCGNDWEAMGKPVQLLGQKRAVYLVFVHEEADKGVQVYESSVKTFDQLLQEQIDNADDDEEYKLALDDPDGGATLRLTISAENIGTSNTWYKCTNIEFKPRPKGLANTALLGHGINLDTCLKRPSAKQLFAALHGTSDDSDTDTDDKPAKATKAKRDKPKADPPADGEAAEVVSAKSLGISKGDEVLLDGVTCTVASICRGGGACNLIEDASGKKRAKVPCCDIELPGDDDAADEFDEDDEPFDDEDDGFDDDADDSFDDGDGDGDGDLEGDADDEWDDDWDD